MDALAAADENLRCPVCEAVELTVPPYANYSGMVPAEATPPYEEWLGAASYEVCPCCGFEFGNDDNPGTAPPSTFQSYRQEWEGEGRPRFDSGG